MHPCSERLARSAFKHHADLTGLRHCRRVGMMHRCCAGQLLVGSALVHRNDKCRPLATSVVKGLKRCAPSGTGHALAVGVGRRLRAYGADAGTRSRRDAFAPGRVRAVNVASRIAFPISRAHVYDRIDSGIAACNSTCHAHRSRPWHVAVGPPVSELSSERSRSSSEEVYQPICLIFLSTGRGNLGLHSPH